MLCTFVGRLNNPATQPFIIQGYSRTRRWNAIPPTRLNYSGVKLNVKLSSNTTNSTYIRNGTFQMTSFSEFWVLLQFFVVHVTQKTAFNFLFCGKTPGFDLNRDTHREIQQFIWKNFSDNFDFHKFSVFPSGKSPKFYRMNRCISVPPGGLPQNKKLRSVFCFTWTTRNWKSAQNSLNDVI